MKKILLGAAGLVATLSMAAPAVAADLPAAPYTKAPSMIAAIYDWSGFYIGLNGGGGSAHKCWDLNSNANVAVAPAFREGCHNSTGGLVGGQMGYRWQTGGFVFGLDVQGDWASFTGNNVSAFNFGTGVGAITNRTRVDALGLFTGQVGYAFNNVLWYVKGGAAVTHDKYSGIVTTTGLLVDNASETRWGGTVGTGVEVSFAPNWSVALEYDHLFMGNRNNTFSNEPVAARTPTPTSRVDNIRQDADIGTVRVNYRWGGPVISKY
jgi:outer membrane immunogenic protein